MDLKQKKPVELKKKYQVKILSKGTKVNGEGDGIAKIDGMVIFIPDSQIEKEYEIQILKIKDKYAFAKIVKEL